MLATLLLVVAVVPATLVYLYMRGELHMARDQARRAREVADEAQADARAARQELHDHPCHRSRRDRTHDNFIVVRSMATQSQTTYKFKCNQPRFAGYGDFKGGVWDDDTFHFSD
jgi:hypothetical protein